MSAEGPSPGKSTKRFSSGLMVLDREIPCGRKIHLSHFQTLLIFSKRDVKITLLFVFTLNLYKKKFCTAENSKYFFLDFVETCLEIFHISLLLYLNRKEKR